MKLLSILQQKRTVEPETLKNAYRRVFASEAGQVVLQDLCTSFKLVQNPNSGHVSVADARAFTDGQRAVCLRILAMLEE